MTTNIETEARATQAHRIDQVLASTLDVLNDVGRAAALQSLADLRDQVGRRANVRLSATVGGEGLTRRARPDQIEAIEVDEDGLASVTASHYPATKVDGTWRSLIAEDVLDEDGSRFYIIQ